jgi:hypothetical protein
MSEATDKLKLIGAQKIYEETHIALAYVKSIINEDFTTLNKVQFIGFISILEREYGLDLSTLKARGLSYFNDGKEEQEEEQGVFVVPQKKRKYTYVYIAVAAVALLVVAFNSNTQTKHTTHLDNKAIDSAKEVITPVPASVEKVTQKDENTTLEKTPEVVKEKEEVTPPKVVVEQSLKIIPRDKVWIGYIDEDTRVKKQTVISKPFSLDPQKSWLLSLGHGNINIDVDGNVTQYHSKNSVRFVYEDGKLKQLSIKEFKVLNKGRLW